MSKLRIRFLPVVGTTPRPIELNFDWNFLERLDFCLGFLYIIFFACNLLKIVHENCGYLIKEITMVPHSN